MKSPQLYIDKLSQVILENSMMSAKPRFWAKKGAGINEEEFLDWSKPLAYYEGDPNNIQQIQVQQTAGTAMNMLQMKIDELKETSSNRDVSQGSSSGGVTAAAAIAALQEAGNKTSRDMISGSYRAYTQECYLAIELIRQFYSEARAFRITGESGQAEYIRYSNANLVGQAIPPAYPGQEQEPGYVQARRKPVFDIVIKPQKRSPYSKLSQNELAKELYQMGFFNPELAEQSLTAIDMMDFDGKQKVKDQVQQGLTMVKQMEAMQQKMAQLGAVVYQLTGQDVVGIQGGGQSGGQAAAASSAGGNSQGQAQKDAQTGTMTAYGEQLAKRATPDVSGG